MIDCNWPILLKNSTGSRVWGAPGKPGGQAALAFSLLAAGFYARLLGYVVGFASSGRTDALDRWSLRRNSCKAAQVLDGCCKREFVRGTR